MTRLLNISFLFSVGLLLLSSNEKLTFECVLKKDGINNIKVDSSTFQNVINEFGKSSIKKERTKPHETLFFGSKYYKLEYESLGITFLTWEKRSKSVDYININSKCKCKTSQGVGINSSYSDIKKEFGQPISNKKRKSRDYYPVFFIENKDSNKRIMSIYYEKFHFEMSSTDTNNAFIKRIKIY